MWFLIVFLKKFKEEKGYYSKIIFYYIEKNLASSFIRIC